MTIPIQLIKTEILNLYTDDKKYYDKNGKEVDKLIALDSNGKRTSTIMDVAKGALDGEKGKSKYGNFKY